MKESEIRVNPGGGVSTITEPASRSIEVVKAKIAREFVDLYKFGEIEHKDDKTEIFPKTVGPFTFHISSLLEDERYVVRYHLVFPAPDGFPTLRIVNEARDPGTNTTWPSVICCAKETEWMVSVVVTPLSATWYAAKFKFENFANKVEKIELTP